MIGIRSFAHTRILGFVGHFAALAAACAVACAAFGVRDLPPPLALPAVAAATVALAPLFWRPSSHLLELALWCLAAGTLGPLLASLELPVSAAAAVRTALVASAWIGLSHTPLWARAQDLSRRASEDPGAAAAPGESASGLEPLRAVLIVSLIVLGAAPAWLDPIASSSPGSQLLGALALDGSPLVHLTVAAQGDLLRAPWFYAVSTLGSSRFAYPGALTVLGADLGLALLAWLAAALWIKRPTRMRPPAPLPPASLPFSSDPETFHDSRLLPARAGDPCHRHSRARRLSVGSRGITGAGRSLPRSAPSGAG